METLTESGICLNKKLVMSGASVMQRLTVEMLCNQLDNTWKYFTATFKMQVRQSDWRHSLCQNILHFLIKRLQSGVCMVIHDVFFACLFP